MTTFAQLLVSGITVGAIYALVAIGFTLVYRASDVFNLAQGEFFMLGGMIAGVMLVGNAGGPGLASISSIAVTVAAGIGLYIFCIRPAKTTNPVQLLIITIGASVLIRGLVSATLGKDFVRIPNFFSPEIVTVSGVVIQTQAMVVILGAAIIIGALWLFLSGTAVGKAIVAVASNDMASRLVGINPAVMICVCFGISALIGAIGGLIATPITMTSYDAGTMLAVKGFAAAMLGGMGTPAGPLFGGLMIGLLEAFGAGYLSSTYKDVFALVVMLLVFAFKPQGIFGGQNVQRV